MPHAGPLIQAGGLPHRNFEGLEAPCRFCPEIVIFTESPSLACLLTLLDERVNGAQNSHDQRLSPMTSAPPLGIRGLTCRYGDMVALDQVTMTLNAGEILGITGAPGAGMSTLIKAIMLLVAPQAGQVLIDGKPHELASSRDNIAYLPETIRPPGHLSGHDFLKMTRTLQDSGVEDVEIVGLTADLDLDPAMLAHPIRRYAKDDVQKLGLIALLSTGRSILLLDRPMSDLEPTARAGLRHRLRDHAASGGAVLIGSHFVEDHQDVVDRLVMLKDGKLIKADAFEICKTTDAAA